MAVTLTIGEFARMTHLSVKTLRHYHRVGLLEPAEVDGHSGYRHYTTAQVPTAQIIKRFRALDMPLETLRAVLRAPDVASRNALILDHLGRMEDQLRQTQDAVTSLKAMLGGQREPLAIEYRTVPVTHAIGRTAIVTGAELDDWWHESVAAVTATAKAADLRVTGPVSGTYAVELFADERGEATVFLPLADRAAGPWPAQLVPMTLPSVELAVAVHDGPHSGIDSTYGALGTYVTEHQLAVAGQVREHYLVHIGDTPDEQRWRTEIGWPVFRTAA